ncbi:MAG: type II toxin-antitoxin system RelE/ParE family toxin [Clostridiales Family XIII bacterium]|jgi:phage-related protein|nr:type II toxin-antitoxin system RelE/ParE family toxin [Clostridiales Family XIII bacterium]
MYKITYYVDSRGKTPVWEHMQGLLKTQGKDNRLNYHKIIDYIRVLRDNGKDAGQPYIKHLQGDIWELRPLRNRILFAVWDEEEFGFVLLHIFMKQTRKTPQRDIDIALRRLRELREGEDNG